MHHKKSEVQIGKESSGVSSDFIFNQPTHQTQTATTYKRPLLTQSLSKSPTLYQLATSSAAASSSSSSSSKSDNNNRIQLLLNRIQLVANRIQFQLPSIRGLRFHVTIVILSFFVFYLIIVFFPDSFLLLLEFVSAVSAAGALLFSLQLALPRLPSSIRRFRPRPLLPVFWAVGRKKQKQQGSSYGGSTGFREQVFSNGDVYQGEIRKGKCWGSGVYYYSMSGRYEGDWVDGKYEGFGVETWARGSRYKGQFKMGLRHGFGVYRFYTGDVYAGEWSSGQSHGCGVHTCDDGSKYVGEFKWGVKHGLGHYHFRNGDTYAGEYFADKMHGFGVYRFANDHLYEGTWHEGRRQGLGMYTFRNGETQSGHWQNGVLDVPSTQNAMYPVSPVGVNHSRILNVVQEARRAAEKAYDVAKVDERVNRAVAAANRAANAARLAALKAVQKQMHPNVNTESIRVPIV
ncbi:hypothetical protein AAHE18_U013400 [Arachis hypogaea]